MTSRECTAGTGGAASAMRQAQKRFNRAHLARVRENTCDASLTQDYSDILYLLLRPCGRQLRRRSQGSHRRAALCDHGGDRRPRDSTVIATDAIAVVVNPANPLTDLTADQLKGIFDGDTARWADLKG